MITDVKDVDRLLEKTGSQLVSVSYGSNILTTGLPSSVTYATYRTIRKDPTVALGRGLLGSAVLSGSWSVECDDEVPDEMVEFVRDNLIPIREQVMEAAIFGSIDFGWVGFEKVFAYKNGYIGLKKLKPLLPDLTEIMVSITNGAFAGYRQQNNAGGYIELPLEKCLHIGFRVEGTQWHGTPLLENVRAIQTKWDAADAGAAQYDKRVAGSHFVVYYPIGTSTYNGVENVDNGTIADNILNALEASGSITVPNIASGIVEELNNQTLGWRIDILEDNGGRQPTFVDRLKYLDALKVRAMIMPERAILEGEFGTKAEAGAHADMALTNIQLTDRYITRHVNWYVVDQLLALNFGESWRSKVRLSPAPLVDEQKAAILGVYQAIIANPQGFLEEIGQIDTDSIKDKLGIPKAKEVAQLGEDNGVVQPRPGLTAEERAKLNQFTPAGAQ